MSVPSHPSPDSDLSPFDRELARAMSDVPLPAGLTARLHEVVNAAPCPPTSAVPTSRPESFVSRRSLVMVGAVAVLLVVGWSWFVPRGPVLSEADVQRVARLKAGTLPEAAPGTSITLPAGWRLLAGLELAARPVTTAGDAPAISLLPFAFRADRRFPRVTGLIFSLPASRWRGRGEAASISQAEVRYTPTGTWVAWREGATVFVCLLDGDTRMMEQFQRAITSGRDMT